MAIAAPDRIDAARAGENFPVASRLVAPALRHAVFAFYRVARGADDVADAVGTDPPAKRARLLALDAVLAGGAAAPDDRLAQDCARLRRTGSGGDPFVQTARSHAGGALSGRGRR